MRILLSILLLLALLPDYSGEARLPLLPDRLDIRATPVALDWRHPARKRLGGLTYLGGVWLEDRAPDFGGFSALAVEGERFTLLSDGGNVVTFRMGADWRVRDARSVALPGGPGSGWRKLDRDSESLAHDPATGRWWVGFERANEIWRYDRGFARAEASVAPVAMARWPANGGAEAMVRLRDGSFIVLSESAKGVRKGVRPGLWFPGDPTRNAPGFAFSYRPPEGYKPTDIAELPDGRLVVINRRFGFDSFFTAAVTIVDRAAMRPGGTAIGRVIARFVAPVVHDNFEGVAVVQERGQTMLWIVSDDNQWRLQRTLLLKFRLNDRP